MQHFLSIVDYSAEELWAFLYKAKGVKRREAGNWLEHPYLKKLDIGYVISKAFTTYPRII